MNRVILGLTALLALTSTPARAQEPDSTRAEVPRAAEAFVDAFNDLDWDRFEDAWAEDASAFFPMPEYPARLNGRDTIVTAFKSIFADLPDRFEGPPYLSIDPVDLRIAVVGTAAVVTFHLGDEPPEADGHWCSCRRVTPGGLRTSTRPGPRTDPPAAQTGRAKGRHPPGGLVSRSDFILRMIERFGQMLIALRNRIARGEDHQQIEDDLLAVSRQAGVDLALVRSFTLDSLLMFVDRDGEIEVDRAWLMAEILSLDGIESARLGQVDAATDSLLKARALYELVGPAGSMLVGIPDVDERIGEIERVLQELESWP